MKMRSLHRCCNLLAQVLKPKENFIDSASHTVIMMACKLSLALVYLLLLNWLSYHVPTIAAQ